MTLLEDRPAENFREGRIPTLETERLILRAPHMNDGKSIAALANDIRIAQNTARIPHPYALADAEGWLANINTEAGRVTFLVTLSDGTVIGVCGIELWEDGTAAHRRAPELGYWLGVPFWGQGYATDAARAVIDHAFGTLEHEVLHAGARVNNPASRRVLEKCGFQWMGVGLYRIRSIASSAPFDRFRLHRRLWMSIKSWRAAR